MKESKVCFPVVEKYFTDIIKYIVYNQLLIGIEVVNQTIKIC
jgi:hypothetical protein